MINDQSVLLNYANRTYNLHLDIAQNYDVKFVLLNGLNLPISEDNVRINAAIFQIASTFSLLAPRQDSNNICNQNGYSVV